MLCPICKELDAVLARLERIHAKALEVYLSSARTATTTDYNKMREAEGAARLDRDLAFLELEKHWHDHQRAN